MERVERRGTSSNGFDFPPHRFYTIEQGLAACPGRMQN
jgi:hypothetical protein